MPGPGALAELLGDGLAAGSRAVSGRVGPLDRARPREVEGRRKISANCCSFSAVSAPIFASKYAFFSILKNIQDCLADILKFGK